jgi:hypothetical protein
MIKEKSLKNVLGEFELIFADPEEAETSYLIHSLVAFSSVSKNFNSVGMSVSDN